MNLLFRTTIIALLFGWSLAIAQTENLADNRSELNAAWAATDIIECTKNNLPQNSSSQTLKFAATDRAESVRELQAHSWWQRSSAEKARVNMRLIGPPDLADSSYLIAQNDSNTALFTYLPSLDKVQRISGQSAAQQLWGTDFSYDDMRFVQGSAFDGEFTRLADSQIQQREVYVVLQIPGSESTYSHIVSYIEPTTCVALQTDFFAGVIIDFASSNQIPTSSPRKRLQADFSNIREIIAETDTARSHWVASELRMDDLQEQTFTTLIVEAMDFEPKLSSSLFNPRSFYRVKAP